MTKRRLMAFAITLVLAIGVCPALAFAAGSNDLQTGSADMTAQSADISAQATKNLEKCTIKFTDKAHANKATDTWQMYYAKGKNVAVQPEFDLYYGKKKIAKSKYTVKYKLTWWSGEKTKSKAAKKLIASASPEAGIGNMASEYQVIVTAKKGSGYTGTYKQATIVVADSYNIGFYSSEMNLAKAKSSWHYAINGMNRNYWVIPQANVKTTLNSLKVKVAGKKLASKHYAVSYYKAKKDVVEKGLALEKATTGKKLGKMPTTAGSYIMVIKGKKPYYGGQRILFDIQDSISKASISPIADQKFTGQAITPSLTVKYNGATLEEGTDYSITWKDNVEVGTATATITGCSKVKTFEYDPAKREQYESGEASFYVEKDKQRFFTGSKTVTFKITA